MVRGMARSGWAEVCADGRSRWRRWPGGWWPAPSQVLTLARERRSRNESGKGFFSAGLHARYVCTNVRSILSSSCYEATEYVMYHRNRTFL